MYNNQNNNVQNPHVSDIINLQNIVKQPFSVEQIEHYDIRESINDHPLAHKPTNIRSKLAYKAIMSEIKPSKRYLLPGWISTFEYSEPKLKEELEYYDATPLVVSLGIMRTNENVIREIGINLHYFPPYTRYNVIVQIYEAFKPYFQKYFNDPSSKPNTFISYKALKHIMKHNQKLGFAIKMYVPYLRGKTFVLPARLLSTAMYTEGHFSKATLQQIFKFWRQF